MYHNPVPVIDVVVPVRNHAASLGALLRELPHRSIRSAVVVDRASTDRSAEIARDGGALVLREPSGGYGAACQRAQSHFGALPRVPDIVVFVPGDRPAAAASSRGASRPLRTISQPACARLKAQARPRPRLEAQMMALRPAIPRSTPI